MLKTRRSRGIFASVFFIILLMLTFGLLGYFVGFQDYGDEWTGFLVGVVVAATATVCGLLFIAFGSMIMRWVYNGKGS